MPGVNVAVSIGEFSRLTHLTVKTLRHYHDLGLLVPVTVDRHSGYRRYGTHQVDDALLIGRLRGLDMPLAEIGRLLGAPTPAERDALLAGHLRRMERELDRTRGIVSSLRELLQPAAAPAVEYRTLPDLTVLAVRDRVDRDGIESWCGAAFAWLYGALRGASPAGPGGATYSDEFFTAGAGEVLAFVPVHPDVPVDQVRLPGGRFAIGLHAGPYSGIDRSYAALGAHVAEHDTVAPGPIREIYLVGPDHADDAAGFRTEVCWPVAP
jgi:DNA-binding transcriptional MerR regulator/effector-binding domain-containing protein